MQHVYSCFPVAPRTPIVVLRIDQVFPHTTLEKQARIQVVSVDYEFRVLESW